MTQESRPGLYQLIIDELLESAVFAKMSLDTWQIALFEEAVKDGRSVWIELTTVEGAYRIPKMVDSDQESTSAILQHLVETPDQRMIIQIITSLTFTRQMFTSIPPAPKPPSSTTTLSVSETSAADAPRIRLPVDINEKGFLRTDDSLLLRGDSLVDIKKWHTSLFTFGRVNGVYIPPWNDYARNKIHGRSWTEDFLGPKKRGQIHQMSQLLHMILLRESVIPRSIQPHVDTADGDGYQALYNLICRHHPNTSVSNMVQTACPCQGPDDYFALHVSNVQLYVAAENSRGRQYTDKEEVAMVMATLHPKFKDALMAKVRPYLTTTEALPYEIHLTTMASTLEEWAKELALPYNPVMPSLSPPALSPKPVVTSPYADGQPVHSVSHSAQAEYRPPVAPSGTIHFPDDILQPLAEEQVLRVMQDPKGSCCEACHLAGHTAEECHALINHAVAHYMLVNDKALRERILAKHKQIVRPRRRASPSKPRAKEVHRLLDSFAALHADADVADADHDDADSEIITRLHLTDGHDPSEIVSLLLAGDSSDDSVDPSPIHVVTRSDMDLYDSLVPSPAATFRNQARPV